MAPAFVSSTANTATAGTSITINAPASIVAGNILVAEIYVNSTSATTITVPGSGGWTQLAISSTFTGGILAVFTKTATGSEPANYTWTTSVSHTLAGSIKQFSGISGAFDGSAAFNQATTATACTAPSQSPTATDDVLVAVFSSTGGRNFTTPTGMTAAQSAAVAGSGNPSIFPFYQLLSSSSATGSISSTQSTGSTYVGLTYLLAAAATGFSTSGSGAITFGGSGTATQTVSSTGTGAIVFAGTGTASTTGVFPTGGTGAIAFAGSGTATVPGPSGTGAITFAGVGVASSSASSATGTGQVVFDGQADADVAPQLDVYAPPEWSWILLDSDGSPLGPLTAATARKVTWQLDDAATASFTMPGEHPQTALVAEMATDVVVSRNGRLLFRGRVGGSTETHSATDDTVTFTAVDYRGMLKHRLVWPHNQLVFTNWDQAGIAWKLIADAQTLTGGNLGITRGVGDPTGILRDRTYTAGSPIDQMITELGEVVDGFDWDVDPHLRFNIYHPQRGRHGQVLTYGRDIVAVTATVNPDAYANAVYFTGGMPATVPVDVALTPPAGFGRWEEQVSDPNLVKQTSVNEAANGAVFAASSRVPALTVTLRADIWNPYLLWLGDTVRTIVQTGRLNLDVSRRIVQIDATLDDNGVEQVQLNIGAAPTRLSDRLNDLAARIAALERVPQGLGGSGYPGDPFGGIGSDIPPFGGGGIQEITSSDGSIVVTNPDGPVTDLAVAGGLGVITVANPFGPVVDLSYHAGGESVANIYTGVLIATGNDGGGFGNTGYSYAWYSFASGPAPTVDWLAYRPASEISYTPDNPTAEDVAQIIAPGTYTLAITFATSSAPVGSDSSGHSGEIPVSMESFGSAPFDGALTETFVAGLDPATTITHPPVTITTADLAAADQYAAWGFVTFPTPGWNTSGQVQITVTLTRTA